MAEDVTLKKLEKNAYLSYHNDGLIDIFIGLYALLFGIIYNNALAFPKKIP